MSKDLLKDIFERQTQFMEELLQHDKMPEWPIDLTTKMGQRLIREVLLNVIEELMEASFCLRNKMHRLTDERNFDRAHYLEELGDAQAYLIETCILSGITPDELYDEYVRKNSVVKQRLQDGY